jgi:uncharacterized protein with PIN domain
MSVLCPGCGREYDITLFQYGRTIECACGRRVGREMKVMETTWKGEERQPRFMVDVMLGRLARWLRVLGFDAACSHDAEDAQLVRVSIDEERILLTRDRALPEEWWIDNYLLIESVRPMEQLRQVVGHFSLEWGSRLFTRCTLCNEPLRPVALEDVLDLVPERVAENATRFVTCPSCGRVYWAGSHVERMRKRLAETFAEKGEKEGSATAESGP